MYYKLSNFYFLLVNAWLLAIAQDLSRHWLCVWKCQCPNHHLSILEIPGGPQLNNLYLEGIQNNGLGSPLVRNAWVEVPEPEKSGLFFFTSFKLLLNVLPPSLTWTNFSIDRRFGFSNSERLQMIRLSKYGLKMADFQSPNAPRSFSLLLDSPVSTCACHSLLGVF